MRHAAIQSFVIVGGGTAGWMTAALLARVLGKTGVKITLLESPEVDSVGVGEATVPSFVDFIQILGISEADFVRQTGATFKLGIKFRNWQKTADGGSHEYWHPFGNVGAKIDGQPFFQQWLRSHFNGNPHCYTDYSPSAAMGDVGKFYIPDPRKPNNLTRMGYALHFDAARVAQYLANFSKGLGVQHVLGHAENILVDSDGAISAICLKNGEQLAGAFFIDCTGARSLLLEGALGVGYCDWRHWLPVDSAVVVQSENGPELPPYTESIAHAHGWRWSIPLQERTGNGSVFCREYCSAQQAERQLLGSIPGKPLSEPRHLGFKTGKREKMWHRNCIAIGLSSGFLEPLESTSIYLIMRAALTFVGLLPRHPLCAQSCREFNRLMDLEYENIRDFIVLHYCTSRRDDSDFWRSWRNREIPSSLREKLSLYQREGRLIRNDLDLFGSDSWHAVLTGMGVFPESYCPLVDASDSRKVEQLLNNVRGSLQHSVNQLLPHREYLNRFCSATS